MVRTVCALACGPEAAVEMATTGHEGHCAQPEPRVAPEAAIATIGDCMGCDLLYESPRGTVRSELVTAAVVPLMPWQAHPPLPLDRATAPLRPASPPFPAQFPLRI